MRPRRISDENKNRACKNQTKARSARISRSEVCRIGEMLSCWIAMILIELWLVLVLLLRGNTGVKVVGFSLTQFRNNDQRRSYESIEVVEAVQRETIPTGLKVTGSRDLSHLGAV
jgi:hypothetical protein